MTKVVMPKLGLVMKEGKITKWIKNEGDMVHEGEILVHIETEKLNAEYESPATGTLHILQPAGATVPVAEDIAEILAEGEVPQATESPELVKGAADVTAVDNASPEENDASVIADGSPSSVRATPAAKKMARDEDVDLAKVAALRNDGVIDKQAIREYQEAVESGQVSTTPLARRIAERSDVDLSVIQGTGPRGKITEQDVLAAGQPSKAPEESVAADTVDELGRNFQRQTLTPLRKVMSRRMSESAATVAPVTLTTEIDMSESTRLKNQLTFKLSFTAIMAGAVTRALVQHPNLNASLVDDEMIHYSTINLGIAVDTESGLLVPSIISAEQKSLRQITDDLRGIAGRAREGKLSLDELTCGTFTLTNLGMFGIDRFTPIVNLPEVAILGVGAIFDKYVDVDGVMTKRPFCSFSLTFDHRANDGASAARFLQTIREYMENPYIWLAG